MCIYYKLHIISGLVLVGLYQCLLLATDYFVMFIMMVLFNNAYLVSIEQNVVGQFLVVIARIVPFYVLLLCCRNGLKKKNGIIKELNDIELLKFIMEEYGTIISVKNTFDGRIIKKNEEYISTKNDTEEEHGIGIKNIITTVDNCGDSYSIRYDGREFYFL